MPKWEPILYSHKGRWIDKEQWLASRQDGQAGR